MLQKINAIFFLDFFLRTNSSKSDLSYGEYKKIIEEIEHKNFKKINLNKKKINLKNHFILMMLK